ncbi:VOC family protein [Noviherbaspirillum saxi]|uniref:VOC family protein n=1 Tax=Noviherbaspirillum saxi TaxID=2320863 RepID=A0A3A3FUQ7_9BURK|nr:VOC family protein [Noviherbaspirillum saxi]RJF99937.1 VOC family protein [Noviherbaspirillum saxi]
MQTKVNWFEIPSVDFKRAVGFYETIFDTRLKVEDIGSLPMGIFIDDQGQSVGCVAHGGYLVPNENGAVLYLDATPGLDAVLGRVQAAGGRVLMGKMALPRELGYIAHFVDTEGNRIALHAEH